MEGLLRTRRDAVSAPSSPETRVRTEIFPDRSRRFVKRLKWSAGSGLADHRRRTDRKRERKREARIKGVGGVVDGWKEGADSRRQVRV